MGGVFELKLSGKWLLITFKPPPTPTH